MSEERYQPQDKAALDELLLKMPGVIASKAFGYPAYKVNGKVFAFVGENGVSIKLPKARVDELLHSDPAAKPFEVVEGTIWKAWVSLGHADASAYEGYEGLFAESVMFVAVP